jgi:serine/threonine protein kinase
MSKNTNDSNDSNYDNDSELDDDEEDSYIDWTYEVFSNKYIMLKKLGKGSYCSVWLSYNFIDKYFLALKVYNRSDFERGRNELKVFDELKSKKINNIILYNKYFNFTHDDYDDNDDNDDNDNNHNSNKNIFLCVEMELCGYSIYDVIKLFKDSDLTPPEDYYYDVIKNTCNILKDIHSKGYVHSDIKPENILLKKPSYETFLLISKINNCINGKFAKINKKNVFDFIKKIKGEINKKNNYNLFDVYKYIFDNNYEINICDMGTCIKPNESALYKKYTIYYRAPETILKLNYDHHYDYWSLGCTIYEMLTGSILFDADDDLQLLYSIICRIGPVPKDLIKLSPYKNKFFTSSQERLRGYKKIKFESILNDIHNIKRSTKIDHVLKQMIFCLHYKQNERTLLF